MIKFLQCLEVLKFIYNRLNEGLTPHNVTTIVTIGAFICALLHAAMTIVMCGTYTPLCKKSLYTSFLTFCQISAQKVS